MRSAEESLTQPLDQATASAMPEAMATTPGMMKAARHEPRSIMAPTNTGPSALPALPNTPLMPSVMPCFFAQATTQAIPTGW